MTSPTAGSRIATHLELRSVLGSGGTATVFEAHHARLQATVAVKVSMIAGEQAVEAEARLVREARICARLREPCFPRVYDIARLEDGRPYYVMERVVGPTLDIYAAHDARHLAERIGLVRQLLVALRVVHDHGIVHRDVKPENAIIEETPDGKPRLRLMDFGIALLDEPGEHDPDVTRTQEMLGTPGYMPAEQARGERVDARSDIHAAGVVLYELLAERMPFDERDPMKLARLTVERGLPDVRIHAPGCPVDVAHWIAKATSHAADDRFQTAREALAELSKLKVMQAEGSIAPSTPVEALHTPLPSPVLGGYPYAVEPSAPPLRRGRSHHDPALLVGMLAALVGTAWLVPRALEGSDPSVGASPDAAAQTAPTTGPSAPAPPTLTHTIEVSPLRQLADDSAGRATHAVANEDARKMPMVPALAPRAQHDHGSQASEHRAERRRERAARRARARAKAETAERAAREGHATPRRAPGFAIPDNPY